MLIEHIAAAQRVEHYEITAYGSLMAWAKALGLKDALSLLKQNLEELLLSVNATLGGAPSAAAMAISRGWANLVLPGLLAGIWGYVIGTFVGIIVTEALKRILPA